MENSSLKTRAIFICGTILCILTAFMFLIVDDYTYSLEDVRSNIGNKIEIKGDTLLITGYDMSMGVYITREDLEIPFTQADDRILEN